MTEALTTRLRELRNADGGWGSTAGRPSGAEHTALVCMAMTAAGLTAEGDTAAEWLAGAQRPDGAWPVAAGVPEPGWATSLAVLALAGRADGRSGVQMGLDWLVGERGIGVPLRVRIAEFFREPKTTALDPTLRGWPWLTGTFSWIEPTAYAMIALTRGWQGRPPAAARSRIDEGRLMILDRECPGGGWNFGNKEVLGVEMEPYPDSTAIALLALRAAGENQTVVEPGFGALDRLIGTTRSGLTLSLAALAGRAWSRDIADLRTAIMLLFEQTAFLDDVRSIAFATLALAGPPSPLIGGDS